VTGLGLVAVSALLGLVATTIGDSAPWPIHTARLFLVLIGSITVGAAVSIRPDLSQIWAVAAATALLGLVGIPAHWDSFRLLFVALSAVAITWTLVLLAPAKYRLPALSALILFHFTGIFLATTSPPTTPWVTEQAFVRVWNPYLQLVYLRNAYHFYSPEPGPASVLVFFLKTETGTDPATGQKQYQTQWVVLPKRPADIKDPLGLSYYRRLSLTEQVARAYPALESGADTFEKNELLVRRQNTMIPLHPNVPQSRQYRLPQPEVARYVLPSYASHVILEYTPDAKTAAKTTVKVYRLEHQTLPVERFVKGAAPYHPQWYLPFFLGEFDAHGNLVDPQEPLLYWLLPVFERTPPPGHPNKKLYIDYLSLHALEWYTPDGIERVIAEDEKNGKVFNWSQLR